ncbi:hypothetical protein Slin15195_G116940 [Septoria linicola]|uniref:Uncharacterized protein n=1 Tax=Septoria linicola TaxID=215465 RepID=A0A9Q9B521_9PEZI|nr:hypothetical protein Slin15195_G116940 [Septoria linicola]
MHFLSLTTALLATLSIAAPVPSVHIVDSSATTPTLLQTRENAAKAGGPLDILGSLTKILPVGGLGGHRRSIEARTAGGLPGLDLVGKLTKMPTKLLGATSALGKREAEAEAVAGGPLDFVTKGLLKGLPLVGGLMGQASNPGNNGATPSAQKMGMTGGTSQQQAAGGLGGGLGGGLLGR